VTLSTDARDLIERLLCDVDQRQGLARHVIQTIMSPRFLR
jgi:hypothetical protein